MTVKELIERLRQFPDDMNVKTEYDGAYYDVTGDDAIYTVDDEEEPFVVIS